MSDWFTGDTTAFQDDFTGVVTEFDVEDGQFGRQIKLVVKHDTPQPRNDGTLSTEKPVWVGITDDWSYVDGRLVHSSGDLGKYMNANSKFTRMLQAAAEGGCREYLTRDDLTPYHGAAWLGLHAHWVTIGAGESYNVKDKETGESKKGLTKGFPAPVEFLGEQVAGSNGASVPAGKQLDLVALGVPDTMLDEWVTLAAGHTADEFLRNVSTDIPNLPDGCRQDVVAALSNGSLYQQLHASV